MPTYNFKRKLKLYVVYNNLKYPIEIYPDVSMSQTFTENPVNVKTLHGQYNVFESATITKANPANFSFTIPCIEQNDNDIVYSLLKDYDTSSLEATLKTADIYVETSSDLYKLEYCVIESGTFSIPRGGIITLSISGSARKLFRVGPNGTNIPGTLQVVTTNKTYVTAKICDVQINSVSQSHIVGLSIELQNKIDWVQYSDIHKSLQVSASASSMYAGGFVLSSRILNGSISQLITETGNNSTTWQIGSAIRFIISNTISSIYKMDFNMPSVVFTNRIDVQDLILQTYDFRMIHNPTNLNTIVNI